MENITNTFRHMAKSKFVRSVFLQVLSVFIIISIAIVAIVFFSFASEINRNILAERQEQLAVIEDTISKRIDEITSIAYNIGTDPTFHLEPVADVRYSGYEMSNTLGRYLVGNSFIEHLAYYRLSEPDTIYVSSGERSLREFFSTNLGMDQTAVEEFTREIRQLRRAEMVPRSFGKTGKTYFAYLYPLPQFSANPQAFVMMLIPGAEILPLLESQLLNVKGEVAIFDADGAEICRVRTLEEDVPIHLAADKDAAPQEYIRVGGRRYVVQRQVSMSNGWTYASVIRLGDIRSGLTTRQRVFILLLLTLMLAAIIALLRGIVVQFKPISNLAAAVTDGSLQNGANGVIDEQVLLSSTIASLQGDSEQKRRFETAYLEAEAASKAKSAFLSNVSHDIRTPMNAIIGMSAIAYKHADDPDRVRDCLRKVQVSSGYLLDVINNVLDMSKIESGRFTLAAEVIDLPQLIDGLTAILQQNIEAKGQQLITEVTLDHERVIGDSVRLTQVFVNILSNAVKFTPGGGTVTLRVREIEPAEAGWGDYVFTFTDTGVGMSAAFVERVFETFSRAEDAAIENIEGTGLGMAIAKNLVEMMGGTIRCESELGRGTTFTVAMHMQLAGADAPASARETAQAAAPDLTGRRVLVAEDNAINREIACAVIGETNAQVVQAVNGKEVVEAFEAHPEGYFDLILMDLQMPVMDGYAATAAIRALPRADAAVPIYAMSASTFDEDVRRTKAAGMNGHLGKPYMPESLYAILEEAMGG